MSNKDTAIKFSNQFLKDETAHADAYLQALGSDEAADDEFCARLIKVYQNSVDKGEFVPFDEAVKQCDVDIEKTKR